MKKICLIFIGLVLASCSSYKLVYVPTTPEIYERINLGLNKIIPEDEFFLAFTKEYLNERVLVKVDGKVIFDGNLSTEDKKAAKVFKIKVGSAVEVKFQSIEKPLILTKDKYKNYKYVYLEREKNIIVVEFNNSTKTLDWVSSPNI